MRERETETMNHWFLNFHDQHRGFLTLISGLVSDKLQRLPHRDRENIWKYLSADNVIMILFQPEGDRVA